jgi:uncharacterized protein (TIGR00255 family)
MLKSMTGFGRCEELSEERKIIVELKAVNHRYLDLSIKIPKKLSFFDAGIRNLLRQDISRGKVDVFITYEDYTENNVCVKYNEDIAKEYFKYLEKMSETFQIENDIRVSGLSRYPDVFTLEEQTVDENELWKLVEKAVKTAAARLVESRIIEGESLKQDINKKLETMIEVVNYIEERSPKIVSDYRQKIIAKVNELLGDTKIEESILATEVIIYADKTCVDEEIVRLKSHIKTMKMTLDNGVEIGRKLDFIAQEMNREANTILSKVNDIEISNRAIDLKTDIEKIREQIQNIE